MLGDYARGAIQKIITKKCNQIVNCNQKFFVWFNVFHYIFRYGLYL